MTSSRQSSARDAKLKRQTGRSRSSSWNASGVLPKTGKNRDKLARLVQRIGRVDAICYRGVHCEAGRGGRRARAAGRL